jgi:putative endonuclease
MYLYILVNESGDKTYVGISADLTRRLEEHNAGKSSYTKAFRPWRIIYTEECQSQVDARGREKYYKSAAGRKKLKTILESSNHCGIV